MATYTSLVPRAISVGKDAIALQPLAAQQQQLGKCSKGHLFAPPPGTGVGNVLACPQCQEHVTFQAIDTKVSNSGSGGAVAAQSSAGAGANMDIAQLTRLGSEHQATVQSQFMDRTLDLWTDLSAEGSSTLQSACSRHVTSHVRLVSALRDSTFKVQQMVNSATQAQLSGDSSVYMKIAQEVVDPQKEVFLCQGEALPFVAVEVKSAHQANAGAELATWRAGKMLITNKKILMMSASKGSALTFDDPIKKESKNNKSYVVSYSKAQSQMYFPIPLVNVKHASFKVEVVSVGNATTTSRYKFCGCFTYVGAAADQIQLCQQCCGACCGYKWWEWASSPISTTSLRTITVQLLWPPWDTPARMVISCHSVPYETLNKFVRALAHDISTPVAVQIHPAPQLTPAPQPMQMVESSNASSDGAYGGRQEEEKGSSASKEENVAKKKRGSVNLHLAPPKYNPEAEAETPEKETGETGEAPADEAADD